MSFQRIRQPTVLVPEPQPPWPATESIVEVWHLSCGSLRRVWTSGVRGCQEEMKTETRFAALPYHIPDLGIISTLVVGFNHFNPSQKHWSSQSIKICLKHDVNQYYLKPESDKYDKFTKSLWLDPWWSILYIYVYMDYTSRSIMLITIIMRWIYYGSIIPVDPLYQIIHDYLL